MELVVLLYFHRCIKLTPSTQLSQFLTLSIFHQFWTVFLPVMFSNSFANTIGGNHCSYFCRHFVAIIPKYLNFSPGVTHYYHIVIYYHNSIYLTMCKETNSSLCFTHSEPSKWNLYIRINQVPVFSSQSLFHVCHNRRVHFGQAVCSVYSNNVSCLLSFNRHPCR